MPRLEALGWTVSRQPDRARLGDDGLVVGRVSLEHNHVYRVLTESGELLAESAGRMKFRAAERHVLPVVGDWVALRIDPTGARSQIREVLPRTTWLSRKAAGRETHEQVLAANLDTILIVFGLDKPVNHRSIERYLALARRGGIQPIVILNKADVIDDESVAVSVEEARSVAGDARVGAVSSRTGRGFEIFESGLAAGRTLALVGPSGVGKSSIVNRLVGREVLATGEVREWDQRGRHTSVHRHMVVREQGGVIIDTPGMRELTLWDPRSLDDAFEDIASLAHDCRFRDCKHETEPGCAVKAAVDGGHLDAGRYENFLKLQRERDEVEQRRQERGYLKPQSKQQAKASQRALRSLYKSKSKLGE